MATKVSALLQEHHKIPWLIFCTLIYWCDVIFAINVMPTKIFVWIVSWHRPLMFWQTKHCEVDARYLQKILIFTEVRFEVVFKKIQIIIFQDYVVKLSMRIKLCECSNFVTYFAYENCLVIISNSHSLR